MAEILFGQTACVAKCFMRATQFGDDVAFLSFRVHAILQLLHIACDCTKSIYPYVDHTVLQRNLIRLSFVLIRSQMVQHEIDVRETISQQSHNTNIFRFQRRYDDNWQIEKYPFEETGRIFQRSQQHQGGAEECGFDHPLNDDGNPHKFCKVFVVDIRAQFDEFAIDLHQHLHQFRQFVAFPKAQNQRESDGHERRDDLDVFTETRHFCIEQM